MITFHCLIYYSIIGIISFKYSNLKQVLTDKRQPDAIATRHGIFDPIKYFKVRPRTSKLLRSQPALYTQLKLAQFIQAFTSLDVKLLFQVREFLLCRCCNRLRLPLHIFYLLR